MRLGYVTSANALATFTFGAVKIKNHSKKTAFYGCDVGGWVCVFYQARFFCVQNIPPLTGLFAWCKLFLVADKTQITKRKMQITKRKSQNANRKMQIAKLFNAKRKSQNANCKTTQRKMQIAKRKLQNHATQNANHKTQIAKPRNIKRKLQSQKS